MWQEVDLVVFDTLRLTASEQEAVYPEVVELAGNRKRLARSL